MYIAGNNGKKFIEPAEQLREHHQVNHANTIFFV